MRVRITAACCFLLLAQLASAQDGLQPIPQGNFQFQPTPLPIEPIRVGEPTPAKRPAPATPIDISPTEAASFTNEVQPANDVIQTAGEAPLRSIPLNDELSPPALLQRALQQSNTAVDGPIRWLTLRESIDRAPSRRDQLEVVKTYWRLSAALADHHHARDEAQLLAAVAQPASPHERAVLRGFQSAAKARQDEATLALIAAQEDLSAVAQLSAADAPLPSDIPFTGAYQTRFDSFFGGRTAPVEMRRIHRTLPHYLNLIHSRASAVADAELSLSATQDAYATANVGLTSVLASFINLRDQRLAFLATVRDYNHAIASYSLNVTNEGLSRDRVVSMLIYQRPAARSVLVHQNEVRPAAATQPADLDPQWSERRGIIAGPAADELVPVQPKPSEFVPHLGVPPAAPLDDTGFRLD